VGERNRNVENALIWQAQVAGFQGQLNQADQFTDRAIQMFRKPDTKETIAQWMLAEATRDAAFGNCARASELTKQALEQSREQVNLYGAANAYARCGQSLQAQALVDELTKRFELDSLLNATWLPIIRAQTELTKGNAAQAIQLLETTRRYEAYGEFWPHYLRAEAYLKSNNAGQAAAEFKTILTQSRLVSDLAVVSAVPTGPGASGSGGGRQGPRRALPIRTFCAVAGC
jgi:predicted Zn-dependent protease